MLDTVKVAVTAQQAILPQAALQRGQNWQVPKDQKIYEGRYDKKKRDKISTVFASP